MKAVGALAALAAVNLGLALAGCSGLEWDFSQATDASVDAFSPDASLSDAQISRPSDASSRADSSAVDGQFVCNNPQVCGCDLDKDCNNNSSGNHKCEPVTHQCVDCLDGTDCDSAMCVSYQCVKRCDADASNPGCGRSFFCGGGGFCIECAAVDDCIGDPKQAVCNMVTGRCVQCVNAADCLSNGAGPDMACSVVGNCFSNGGGGGGGSSSGGSTSSAHDQ